MKKIFLFILSLGLCYANSLSEDEIVKLKASCDIGNSDDCIKLGSYYSDINMIKKDNEALEKSIAIFTKACELNNAYGCYNLAIEYKYSKNDEKSYMLFLNKACELNNANSCGRLAGEYGTGNTVLNKDMSKSKFFYKKACKLGNILSCDVIKRLF